MSIANSFKNFMFNVLKCILYIFAILPLGVLYLMGDIIYYPLYYVARYRRKVVRKNLVLSYPEKVLKR
jgi:hypothetical protein